MNWVWPVLLVAALLASINATTSAIKPIENRAQALKDY